MVSYWLDKVMDICKSFNCYTNDNSQKDDNVYTVTESCFPEAYRHHKSTLFCHLLIDLNKEIPFK